MPAIFALVDCNNFYVSCQRVFNPALHGRPVIVLSNNDGCVISRSAEAKQLGIQMGAPYFKIRAFAAQHNVAVFSSNYALYADMSHRVMDTLAEMLPEVEVYSIDEAFVRLDGLVGTDGLPVRDMESYGRNIIRRVRQWTGLPVSIGIAATKTLAKLANGIAKYSSRAKGLLVLDKQPLVELALSKTPVGDVWGIGRNYKRLLLSHDIVTAFDLSRTSDLWIRQHMGIMGHRIVTELRGLACAPAESVSATKKGLTCSRSFGRPVISLAELKEAVALYMSRAAEKLREQQSCASHLTVFIRTGRFRDDLPQHSEACHTELPIPADATPELLRYAMQAVERLFKEGYSYSKAGVMLTGLLPASQIQTSLFDVDDHERLRAVSKAMDSINKKMGSDTVYHAAAGNKRNRSWAMRRAALSPSYTTRWKDIPVLGEPVNSGS